MFIIPFSLEGGGMEPRTFGSHTLLDLGHVTPQASLLM